MAKNEIFTGGGRLYFAKQSPDGTFEPLVYFGKTDGITMTTSVEFKEHYDTEGCTPLLDARLPSSMSTQVQFTTADITIEMLNRAFLGNLIDNTQTAGTDITASFTGDEVKVGHICDIGYYNATNLVLTDDTSTVTYIEGTDYEFDSKAGFITIIDGGTIIDGDSLIATFDTPALEYQLSATMKNSDLIGRFEVVTSSQTGNNYRYVFKRLSVTQDGDFAIKSPDEISTLSFTGSAMIDTGTVTGTLSDYLDIVELHSEAC
jgi:hypothetical protein